MRAKILRLVEAERGRRLMIVKRLKWQYKENNKSI